MKGILSIFFCLAPALLVAAPGDTPCSAVDFSTCSSIGNLSYNIANSANWYAPASGIVNPSGACAGTGTFDANYWLRYTATQDDHSIIFNFIKPSGTGSVGDCGIQIFSAADCSSAFTLVSCQNNSSDGHAVTSSILVTPGLTYFVRLYDASGNGAGELFQASLNISRLSLSGSSACNARSINTLPYSFSGNTLCQGNTIAADCAGKTAGVIGTGDDYYFAYTSSGNEYIKVSFNGLNAAINQALTVSNPVASCTDFLTCYSEMTRNGSFPGGLIKEAGTDSALSRILFLKDAGTYYLIADASGFRGGRFTLGVASYSPDSLNDICQFAENITTATKTIQLSNTSSSPDQIPLESAHPFMAAGTSVENSKWFTFVADSSGAAISIFLTNLSISKADYPATAGLEVGIYQGSCADTWSAISPVSAITQVNTSFMISPVTPGTQYYLIADGKSGSHCTFDISATNVIALPVTLVSFEADKIADDVLLEWITASERGISTYKVERSSNGVDYKPTSLVVNARGTLNDQVTYRLTDHQPFAGLNYYRLSTTDVDGKSVITGYATVKMPAAKSDYSFQIYPNPTDGIVNIRMNESAATSRFIYLTDLTGKRLHEMNSGNETEIRFDLSAYPPGLYFIVVEEQGHQTWKQVARY